MEYNNKSWMALFKILSWEFPVAVQKWMLSEKSGNQEIENLTLKAYHAWVNLANESVDRFYQTKGFCELMTGSLNWLLQSQRLSRSIADAWMPDAMGEMRKESKRDDREIDQMVERLGREVRQLTARLNILEGCNGLRARQIAEIHTDSLPR
jgi:hypothetical protein